MKRPARPDNPLFSDREIERFEEWYAECAARAVDPNPSRSCFDPNEAAQTLAFLHGMRHVYFWMCRQQDKVASATTNVQPL